MAVNINQEMQSLGHMGARSYAPTDELIDQLLSRTKRARAVRQGAVSVVSAVSAIALGAVAVQVINATKDDPAFRDRNLINDRSELTPIEKYRASYGDGAATRIFESDLDTQAIYQDLKVAAQAAADLKELGGGEAGDGSLEQPKGGETCTAKDHPSKPYKTWDCGKNDWVTKSGWFWDPYANNFVECKAQNSYAFGYYDCKKGKWIANNGYFLFFDDIIYQTISWKDEATGITATGNYSPGYDKLAFANPSKNYYDDYKHLDGNATWNAASKKCVGVTKTIKNAPFQFSCLTDGLITADNGSGGKVEKHWILKDARYKWHSGHKQYYCIEEPPAGWEWNGSEWVEVLPAP